MEGSFKPKRTAFAFAAPLTNAIACLWGAAAAYLLWHSLIITHNARFSAAASASLAAVWATLERKRWGRLAMMGLSITTVGAFAFLMGAFGAFGKESLPQVQMLGSALRSLARMYGFSVPAVIGLVALAAATGLWMLHPAVSAEFNHNKKLSLAGAQRGIAVGLVCCWAAAIAQMPMQAIEKQDATRSHRPVFAVPRRQLAAHHAGQILSNLPIRSEAASKSR